MRNRLNKARNAMEVDEAPGPVAELVSKADEEDEVEAVVKLDELIKNLKDETRRARGTCFKLSSCSICLLHIVYGSVGI